MQVLKAENGLPYLYSMLKQKSPADAERIHPNDQKRIIRRLEIIRQHGDEGGYDFMKKRQGYDFEIVGLTADRQALYARIEERVDKMIGAGLEQEVWSLYQKYGRDLQSLQGIGYKEMVAAFEGSYSFDEAVKKIKQATRNFAKRQMTWFARDDRIKWFNTTYYPCLKEMNDDIIMYIIRKK